MYGLGWVHAQDRILQMYMKKLAASGRLSEVAGAQTIETDKFFRSLGLHRTAKEQAKRVKPDAKRYLQAYCDGINDYMNQLPVLPLEFYLIGLKWENWTIEDTFAYQGLINLFLSLDFLFEPFKSMVAEKYGEEFAKRVFAGESRHLFDNTTILDDEDLLQMGLYEKYEKAKSAQKEKNFHIPDYVISNFAEMTKLEFLEKNYYALKGSNNWAVSGNHTESGYPILANDPHLDNVIPSFWYQVEFLFQQDGRERFLIGTTMPGMAIFATGRNDYISWGITNNMVDTSDLYMLNVRDDREYLYEGQWVPLREIEEVINVKGAADPVRLRVQFSHHGPILNNIFDIGKPQAPFDFQKKLAFSWIGFLVEDHSYQSSIGLVLASSLEEFEENCRRYTGSVLNMVFATTDNHIGYYSIGRLPVRNDQSNIFIQDGSRAENNWIRFYNTTEQPRVVDPKKGFIVTANNKLATDNLVSHISVSSSTHARSMRITDLLRAGIASGRKLTVADMKTFQLDVVDGFCLRVKADVSRIFRTYRQTPEVLRLFNATILATVEEEWNRWNCEMSSESSFAGVYGIFEHRIVLSLLAETTPNWYYNQRIVMNLMFDHFLFLSLQDWSEGRNLNEFYCVNAETRRANSTSACLFNFFSSFQQAYLELEAAQGSNHRLWRWGSFLRHAFIHTPFSETPLRPLYERAVEGYGNRRTINVGGINLIKDSWKSFYAANLRCVMDMKPGAKSYYVVDTGISENPLSPHYQDQMIPFRQGQYFEMRFGKSRLSEYPTVQTISFRKPGEGNQEL